MNLGDYKYLLMFFLATCFATASNLCSSEPISGTTWRPPVAAVTGDGSTAYIAQYQPGKIMRLQVDALDKGTEALEKFIDTKATHIIDMQVSQVTNELLIICDQPPRLIRQPLAGGEATTVPLVDKPARLALAPVFDGVQQVCITMPWSKSVWIGVLSNKPDMDGSRPKLNFLPREVLPIDENRFLVADAFASQMAIVDAPLRRVVQGSKFIGYHVSGLALEEGSKSILVSHQELSTNAHTDKDDIRWGNLIQNNVAAMPLSTIDADRRWTPSANYRMGDFGHGSADPAAVVSLGNRFAVAISGTNEVAIFTKSKHQAKYVSVGRVPDRLLRLRDDHLLCLHRLDARIAVINCSSEVPILELMLGEDRLPKTPTERGELAFFSGQLSHDGWMSCHSCHIDGHSPDLLVDTLGDGSFDSPKKIPTLANVSETGPWAWHGGQFTLREQISKTLTSTMHIPEEFSPAAGLNRESLVDDLAQYLSSLKVPTSSPLTSKDSAEQSAVVAGGEALFQQHCGRCHDPDQHYTTPNSYDVGINDERGQKLFNPPSLEGLRYRQNYMHDGRYKELDQIINNHPQPTFKFTPDEQLQLKSYLQRL